MRSPRRPVAVLIALLTVVALAPALASTPAVAAPTAWAPEAATYGMAITNDVPITMPDGRILRASVHVPTELATGQPANGPFPVILSETPYGKTFVDPIPAYLVERGYIGVGVDVAGTGGSQGQSQLFGTQESEDSVDVINWVAALPHSNGKVGMVGISYLAIDQLFAAAEVGPNSPLKAIFPVAASVDPLRDLFSVGGIVNMESSLGLIAGYFGDRTLTPWLERASDPADALRLMMEHALAGIPFELTTGLDALLQTGRVYDGPYWQERAPQNVLSKIVANDVAMYLVGGQYDVFQRGEPLIYSELQNIAAGLPQYAPMTPGQPVTSKYQLLFGPWDHGDEGAGIDLNALQLQWFDHWLKGEDTGILDTTTPLHVIQPDNTRYEAQDYPLETTSPQRYYLNSGGKLGTAKPNLLGGADPLLFTGTSNVCTRSTQQWSAGLIPAKICGASEPPALPAPVQLTYTSPALPNGMKLAGPVGVRLNASATSTDTMFSVTVEDVAPNGTAVSLSSGAQLGSMRAIDPSRSWTAPNGGYLLPYHPLTQASALPVKPLVNTVYNIEIRPIFATLAPGHKLRIMIGTGDLPHLLPPPMKLLDLAGLYLVQHNSLAMSWID
ncbi:MAG: CocE/NonD family hydrolase, partial [Jatrophihabitantaceae bacterium]